MAQLNDLLVTGNSRFLNEINGQIDWSNILNKPAIGTGTITSVKTTAGAHTTINVTSGAANFNVPTKTSHLTNDSGFVTTDTKNTAGSTDTSSKLFLIGATSQATSSQTYSQDTAYVGTDGCLYSHDNKVLTEADSPDFIGDIACSNGTINVTPSAVSGSPGTYTINVQPWLVTDYGECNTAAATAAKVVSVTNSSFLLYSGVTVRIKFDYANTASAPTLNVNSTGAKNIVKWGTTAVGTSTSTSWTAGSIVSFTYDGTSWVMNDHIDDTNTTYAAGTGVTITGTNNAINVTYGTAANTACQGNDSRLSNARPSSDVVQTYSSTSTVPISGKGVAAALGTLDGTVSGTAGAGKTLTAFSQTDGKVSATFGDISITKSQVSDFPTSMTPTSHTHGNIQNGGTLQTNDITIASGDKLVVTDSSDSSKVARTSISFDGSTANKCLTQKGTWESFTNNTGTVTSVKVGSTSYSPSSGVVSLPAYPTTLPASDTTSTYSATGTAPVNGTAVAAALATISGGIVPSAYCDTAAGTAAKTAICSGYTLRAKSHVVVNMTTTNTAASALTLNINNTGAKPIYINGDETTSARNNLPAGTYLVYYDGTNYYFETDGTFRSSCVTCVNNEYGYSNLDARSLIIRSSDLENTGIEITGVGGGSTMFIFPDNITNTSTWDGTNTKLKDTISSINTSIGTKAATSDAIKNITRSGTTFTATRADNTTFTFTQQDTTYSAGTALTLSGTTINHDNYVTAGTAGTGSATHGSTLSVPYVKVNAQGHVTAWGTHTHTVNGLQYQTDNVSRVVMMSDGQVSVQTKGYLSCNNYANSGFKPMSASAFNVSSSRKVKENIKPITDEEAYKLLEVNPVSFDYIEQVGGDKNQFGVIAEEVNETIPFVVNIPENYDEKSEDYMHVPSVDYSKFVPHMIKLIQLQEEKIESMNQEIEKLKSFVDQT